MVFLADEAIQKKFRRGELGPIAGIADWWRMSWQHRRGTGRLDKDVSISARQTYEGKVQVKVRIQ